MVRDSLYEFLQRKKGLKTLDGYVHRFAAHCSKHCKMDCDVVNQTVGRCTSKDDSILDSTLCDFICPNMPLVSMNDKTVQ